MKVAILISGLVLLLAGPAATTEEGNEILAPLVKKSHYVVKGVIASEPTRREVDPKTGLVLYTMEFRSEGALNGYPGSDETFQVVVRREESKPEDRPAHLRNGAKVILFLKSASEPSGTCSIRGSGSSRTRRPWRRQSRGWQRNNGCAPRANSRTRSLISSAPTRWNLLDGQGTSTLARGRRRPHSAAGQRPLSVRR
jgi:hypothetical protein